MTSTNARKVNPPPVPLQTRVFQFLKYLVLTVGCMIIAAPLYLTVITALKTRQESTENFFSLPTSFYLGNFQEVINKQNYFTYLGNTLFITVVSLILMAIVIPSLSYALARNMRKSKFYRFSYIYLVIGLFVPFQVVMVPLVKLASKFNLSNIWGLILFNLMFALRDGVFLFVAYIDSAVPLELEESAHIDGCSVFRTYASIVFPLLKPMTVTILILNALSVWNDFMLPLLLLNKSKSSWTLQLFQYNFKTAYTFDYNLAFASFLLSMLPIMIVYIFSQKYIIQGLTNGAVKG
ncbi:MAG: carbohydrate ABC transporter permease [Clostridiales bacterium]|nr:carbohydrate ABC transporter permease [Clostridiales bacterium]